jgi:RNA polymerase sigma-70 factor (ECF subfamily)
MGEIDDQQIINRVLKGEVDAFSVLVRKYQKPIYNLMYRLTGSSDQAADLTQEALIKAYGNLERFRPGRAFFSWLYAIGLNHGRDFLRKNKLRHYVEWDPEYMALSNDLNEHQNRLDDQLDFQRLETALNQMPLVYREAVILRYHEDMSMRDTAAALEVSLSAAKMRVSRGLEMLRQILKVRDDEKG